MTDPCVIAPSAWDLPWGAILVALIAAVVIASELRGAVSAQLVAARAGAWAALALWATSAIAGAVVGLLVAGVGGMELGIGVVAGVAGASSPWLLPTLKKAAAVGVAWLKRRAA